MRRIAIVGMDQMIDAGDEELSLGEAKHRAEGAIGVEHAALQCHHDEADGGILHDIGQKSGRIQKGQAIAPAVDGVAHNASSHRDVKAGWKNLFNFSLMAYSRKSGEIGGFSG